MKKLLLVLLFSLLMLSGCQKKTDSNTSLYWGLFASKPPTTTEIKQIKNALKTAPHLIVWDSDFETPFPKQICTDLLNQNCLPYIQWRAEIWQDPNSIQLSHILNGDWDDYIKKWAQSVAEYQYPVFISWRHPSVAQITETPCVSTDYWACYKKIRTLFTDQHAQNAIFVWQLPANASSNTALCPDLTVIDWLSIETNSLSPNTMANLKKQYPHKPIMLVQNSPKKIGEETADLAMLKNTPVKAIIYPKNWFIKTGQSLPQNNLFKNADIDQLNTIHLNLK